jgi:glyoxylase-like metal-dependent hydrolase (beta-lactamase superfamily II)
VIRIGDVEVHRIDEHIIYEPMTLFPDFRPEVLEENLPWLVPHFYDTQREMFPTSVHSWLLKTPTNTIVIDTCGGNGKTRPVSPRFHMLETPYLDRLAAAGVQPEQVDHVILTHLHVDHVGWNTRWDGRQWTPTFPSAKYIMSRTERDAQDPARGAKGRSEGANLPFVDSVQPVLDAGFAQIVDDNETLFPGIDLMPIPGHTPGQMAIRARSRGEEAVFAGDIAHQPIQVAMPHWSRKYCADPIQSTASRRRIFGYCAEHNCLMLPVHFGWPYCGRIARRGNGFAYLPHDREP